MADGREIKHYLDVAVEKLLRGELLDAEEIQLMNLANKTELLDSLYMVVLMRGKQIFSAVPRQPDDKIKRGRPIIYGTPDQLVNYRKNLFALKTLANRDSLNFEGQLVPGISREEWLGARDSERKETVSDLVETLRTELVIHSKRLESELRMKGTREETIKIATDQWVKQTLAFYVQEGYDLEETINRFRYLNITGAEFQMPWDGDMGDDGKTHGHM